MLWHGHPGPWVPTARKRLSALAALVGAMRMAAIVTNLSLEEMYRRGIKGVVTCFDRHHAGPCGYCGDLVVESSNTDDPHEPLQS